MNFKKSLMAAAITATLSSPFALAAVSGYEFRVATKITNGEWLELPIQYSNWQNTGNHYNCNAWQPGPELVNFGQSYLQSRLCQQDRQREATLRQEHRASGEVQVVRRFMEQQTIGEEESQIAMGERRDWQTYDSSFTSWEDHSGPHAHAPWSPIPGIQVSNYTQNRSYLVTQERFEQQREQDLVTSDIRDVGEPIRHDRDDSRSESRTITVTSALWSNTTDKVCGAWSPEPLAVDFGQDYTQARTCDQEQERLWTHNLDGIEIHSRREIRTNTFEETQVAVGERRNWQSFDSTFSDWTNVGARKNHTIWAPVIDSQMNDFTQARDFQQAQQRIEQEREQDQVTSDVRNVGAPITHDQTIPGTESRDIVVSITSWSNSGPSYGCTDWSPALDAVDFGVIFTQFRDCSQDQTRTRAYTSDSITIQSFIDPHTVSVTESQEVVGSYRNWEATSSNYTEWVNEGARRDFSAWTPSAQTQEAGFSQSRTYRQDQTRYEQKRERDSVTGDLRNVGSPVLHEQAASVSESRSVEVSWGSWVNTGSLTNCGAWGPLPGTVSFGESFTQSRDCDQTQTRDRSYISGSETIHTQLEIRTVVGTDTQEETGTKRNWQPTGSEFTEWTNEGAPKGYGSWIPSATTQTVGFGQNRTYLQDQVRYEQKRERDSITGDFRTTGSPIPHRQTLNDNESRSVSVTVGEWITTSTSNCGPTSIDHGAYVRTCLADQQKTIHYESGNAPIHSRNEFQSVTIPISEPMTETTFTVQSNDHSSGAVNVYFNYWIADVQAIMGDAAWINEHFVVRNNTTGAVGNAVLWGKSNGGSIGDGHGRWGNRAGDWEAGHTITVLEGPIEISP